MIMRGVVAPIFGLLAVASVIFGVLNATIWKPSSQITATTSVSGTQYVVTDPSVLTLVDTQATLTVQGQSGTQVCVAFGSSKDVTGWVAGYPYTRITGLSDWTTLSTEQASAQGTRESTDGAVDFQNSDMWSSVKCGTGSVSLSASEQDTDKLAIIDFGQSITTPATITLHWVRQTLPDFAMPLYFIGGLCVVLTILSASVFAMPPHKRRKRMVASEPVEVAEEVTVGQAVAGSLSGLRSAVKVRPKKRRRHARRADDGKKSRNGSAQNANETESEAPLVVDPSARNLVADQQHGESQGDDIHQTTVINTDELQAYFARLAQEMGDSQSSSGEDAESSTDAASLDDQDHQDHQDHSEDMPEQEAQDDNDQMQNDRDSAAEEGGE